MSQENIIRAWKDADFRNSLSTKERALLPQDPAGMIELSDTDLKHVGGGAKLCEPTWGPVCGNGSTCKPE
ncbi:mersacidin/lichenicidin family type 2 lantibiotic [Alkalinema sp. FACHB-956]|uniref:mersacidin/lichenicidin family type 2 lantibiotic n=1 Tax=Alkalinema sp. FACHB-956 TaxID=2692768 RepID=UPI001681D046|nr:mersacidin/lichenicidin family type 2 lantibiotic [Alkalinema sp. FACHB-956]MBD2328721.1 mersacidin/lichenicidin family type 2 lantibiotic [Alkalinema sp. FACHB-956]